MRYRIVRIRFKMSYMGLLKAQTINELFMTAILKTYQIQITQGDIKNEIVYTKEANKLFKEQIGEEMDVRTDAPDQKPGKPGKLEEA